MEESAIATISESDENKLKCDLCAALGKESEARNICQDCEENLCEDCSMSHKSQKATKLHSLADISENQNRIPDTSDQEKKKCEPCTNQNKCVDASMFCKECDELLCTDCSSIHSLQKLTKSHELISVDQMQPSDVVLCEPCLANQIPIPATKHCSLCEEHLCGKCVTAHKSQKATKDHQLMDISDLTSETKINKACEPCTESGKVNEASEFCTVCEELLCIKCVSMHQSMKATKCHKLIKVSDIPSTWCEPCLERGTNTVADKMCSECEEALCSLCVTHHKAQKVTRNHELQNIKLLISDIKSCDPCAAMNKETIASRFCEDCEKYYCDQCSENHLTLEATRNHKLIQAKHARNTSGEMTSAVKVQESFMELSTEENVSTAALLGPHKGHDTPGKPAATEVKSDSIELHWAPPSNFGASSCYQIRYKDTEKQKWYFYPDNPDRATVTIDNLQAKTAYKFQVRAITNDEEGPYSPESGEICTKASLASRLLEFTTKVKDDHPSIYQLHSTENKAARNEHAKTRKFELGKPPILGQKEKTILLVGATGSGKSTLVDGIINYVTGVNWQDPYRFSLVDLEKEEKDKNQAVSQTEWITCYTINPEEGGRLDYRLKIIDTPGFGDTRGLERDDVIVKQLTELFSAKDAKGIVFIDAVCFLIKAPDARLTAVQKYIFMSILSIFGQDIKKNICTLITFADGKKPPVLAAMKEAELPFDSWYVFNNSGLFASNDENESSLAPMFWDMGNKSFKKFFDCLDKLPTKSLQQTQQVLHQRERLEIIIQNLQPQVDAGLSKLHELNQEIEILNNHERAIKDNENFEYVVDETKQIKTELPHGQHTTNCLQCNVTCHASCAYANDEDKINCSAMRNGVCTVCDQKCSWQQHANTPYIFTFETVQVKKTYAEKLAKYRQAGEKKLSHEQVITRMMSELECLREAIQSMMEDVNECNNILKVIALQPNPLTMVEHIDLMIESEKMEKKDGFMERISMLQSYRRKADIHKDVSKLEKGLKSTGTRKDLPAFAGKQKTTSWNPLKKLSFKNFFS